MGRDSMQFHRVIHGGQHDAHVCTRRQTMGERLHTSAHVGKPWVNVCTRRQTDQRRPGQHDAIPCGPGLDAQPWIPGDPVGVPSSDPWAGTRCSSLNRFHGGRDWLELRAGTRCSSLDGSQGTWLEFHRVIHGGQHDAHVCKPWVNVCTRLHTSANRAGRKKVCRGSVLFPLGAIGRKALEGPKTIQHSTSDGHHGIQQQISIEHAFAMRSLMRSQCVREVGNRK